MGHQVLPLPIPPRSDTPEPSRAAQQFRARESPRFWPRTRIPPRLLQPRQLLAAGGESLRDRRAGPAPCGEHAGPAGLGDCVPTDAGTHLRPPRQRLPQFPPAAPPPLSSLPPSLPRLRRFPKHSGHAIGRRQDTHTCVREPPPRTGLCPARDGVRLQPQLQSRTPLRGQHCPWEAGLPVVTPSSLWGRDPQGECQGALSTDVGSVVRGREPEDALTVTRGQWHA